MKVAGNKMMKCSRDGRLKGAVMVLNGETLKQVAKFYFGVD